MLDFDTVYRIMRRTPDGDMFAGLAINPRPVRELDGEGVERDGFEWIPNSPFWPRKHAFLREYETGPNGRVVASEVDTSVKYVFDPLTLENLAEVQYDIEGYDQLVKMIDSDANLQEFFRVDWGRDDWTLGNTKAEVEESLARYTQRLQKLAEEAARVSRQASQELAEAKAARMGEVRHWKSVGWVKKTNDGWIRVDGPESGDSLPAGTVREVGGQGQHFQKQGGGGWEPVERGDRGELPGEWKDHAEGLPKNTRDYHWDDEMDAYTFARQELHQHLIDRMLRDVRPVDTSRHTKHAVITMGIPASGKSDAVRDSLNTSNYAHVDPDKIREQLPEFKEAVDQRAKDGGSIVADETNNVADRALFTAISKGMNVVLEGVVASPEWYEKQLVPHLKKNGYKVSLLMVHEPDVESAIQRAERRGNKTGRFVPETHIRKAHPRLPKNFVNLAQQVDGLTAYHSGKPPIKMWSREDGREVVHDTESYEAFLRHAAVEWWEVLLGMELTEGADKPTEIPWDAFLDVMEKAWEQDREAIESLPDVYDQGVAIPIVPIDQSRKK